MSNGGNTADYPFRVFVSHKVSGHGNAAESIKAELENLSPDKLHVFASPAQTAGVTWQPELLREIEAADLFVMLYLTSGFDMDWCLYEAGYFEREAQTTNRKLICVTNPGFGLPGPLETRQRLEATTRGIEDLLRAVLADDEKPVRPDLFDRKNQEKLDGLIEFILSALSPVKREPLSPRMWITLRGDEDVQEIMNGSLPPEVRLEGESEALREFGVGPGAGITLRAFYDESEFREALDMYIPHVATCIRRIIRRKSDLWVIPPVRVVKDGQPKVLVPAYFEEGLGNTYTFEFIVYQPQPDYKSVSPSDFGRLYNVFVLGWQFRRRVIDEWLEKFKDMLSMGQRLSEEEMRRDIQKFRLVMSAVLLEALNRDLTAPRRISVHFPKEQDKKDLKKMLDPEDGLWTKYYAGLEAGLADCDLEEVVRTLTELGRVNKDITTLVLGRLSELAQEW